MEHNNSFDKNWIQWWNDDNDALAKKKWFFLFRLEFYTDKILSKEKVRKRKNYDNYLWNYDDDDDDSIRK